MAKSLLAVTLFALASGPLQAQNQRVQVNESIEKGVDFLLSRQLIDGSWGGWVNRSVYPTGVAPLVVYTLLKCGLPSDHPAIVRAFAWMESRPPLRVYNAGFLLLALEAARDPEKVPWMEETAGDLLSWMPESGLFDYPGQHEDLSNTLIAGLGLDACEKAGIRIPSKYWKRLYTGTLTCITPVEIYWDENGAEIHRRGFSYRPGAEICGSMTAAGISLLEICAKNLGEGLASRHRKTMKRIQEDSLRWLGDFFALSGNPPNRSWGSFNLWGYERVGALMEIDQIGDHDWYQEGATKLVKDQLAIGSWHHTPKRDTVSTGWENHAELKTCMALLFLRKATASAVSGGSGTPHWESDPGQGEIILRASGDTPMTFWISSPPIPPKMVRYFFRRAGEEEWEILKEKTDPAQGFAFQYGFSASGEWEVRCEAESTESFFKSGIIRVQVELILENRLVDYAREGDENLLLRILPEVRVSSSMAGHPEGQATDSYLSTCWMGEASDPAPFISLVFPSVIKANRILLTHPRNMPSRWGLARPRNLAITVNSKLEFDLEMPKDESWKGILQFSKTTSIKTIEFRILSAWDGEPGQDSLGFAEIEIQKTKR